MTKPANSRTSQVADARSTVLDSGGFRFYRDQHPVSDSHPRNIDEPPVSVIISNLNGGDRLLKCLASLRMQEYNNLQIILVDNGSTDGSCLSVSRQFPEVQLIRNDSNLGFAGGGNVGASRAKGDFLLFLNHDMEFAADFLHELVHAMIDNPRVGIAQAAVLSISDRRSLDNVGSFYTSTGFVLHRAHLAEQQRMDGKVVDIFGGAGGAILVRREPFLQLGGFDSDYIIYAEDIDLSWRFWLYGLRVVLVPTAIIYHVGGHTTRRLPSEFVVYHTFKNRLCTNIKNASTRQLIKSIPLHLALCGLGAAYFALRLRLRAALAVLRAILWNVANLQETLKKRSEVWKTTAVDPDQTIRRLQRGMPVDLFLELASDYIRLWGR